MTITGGRVRHFALGVLVGGATEGRICRLVATHNHLSGLLVFETSDTAIERVTVRANGLTTDQAGMSIFGSLDLVIARNEIVDNGDIGVYSEGLDDSRIRHNVISGNPESGVLLDGSGNTVRGNRISGAQDAIIVNGDENVLEDNRLAGTGSP